MKKRKPKKKISDEAELQMALALSKSLHDAEQLKGVQHDLTKSKSPLMVLRKDDKELIQNDWLIRDKPTIETYELFKKRKFTSLTTLQLSSTEIRDRILTSNLATILIENEVIKQDEEIQSQKRLSTIERVIECNNFLQTCNFVDNEFWFATTFRNEHLPIFISEHKFMSKKSVEEKTGEMFEYLRKARNTFFIYKQNNIDNKCSEVTLLFNDNSTAIRQNNCKGSNRNSLNCYSETTIKKRDKKLYEYEANEDKENFNVLWNMVNLCSINENIHEFLKRLQLFPETNQHLLMNLINMDDLDLHQNPQSDFNDITLNRKVNEIKHKFNSNVVNEEIRKQKAISDTDSNETCSSKHVHKQAGNLLDEEKKNLTFDNKINSNKEDTEESSFLDLIEQEIIVSTENSVILSKSSLKMTEFIKSNSESIKSTYPKKRKSRYLSTEFTNADASRELKYDMLHFEEIDFVQWKGTNKGTTSFTDTCIDNVTPVDYNIMKTPQIMRELQKYGLKLQNRHRAIQLLNHIHGNLHPAMSSSQKRSRSNTVYCSIKTDLSFEETYSPLLCKNKSRRSDLCGIGTALTNETGAQAEAESEINFENLHILHGNKTPVHSRNILERFFGSDDKLLEKMFKYQPLKLNEIRMRLKVQGITCKNHTLLKFLDAQSATFFAESQKKEK